MVQRIYRSATSHPQVASRAGPLLAAWILLSAVDAVGDTTVYRCTGPGGEVELSQVACPPGVESQEVTVDDRRTGWTPPRPADEPSGAKRGRTRGDRRPPPSEEDAAAVRRADQCWNRRRQLDEVNWKLRRGYKAAEGIKLRNRRRGYEQYLKRYCRGQ